MNALTLQGSPTLADNEQRVSELLQQDWSLVVGGELVGAVSDQTYEVTSPYSQETIARVPNGAAADAQAAVAGALTAAPDWGAVPAPERAGVVLKLAEAVESRAHDLALLDTIDGGAPIGVMLNDIHSAVSFLRYYAGLALEMKGNSVPASSNLHFTERQPYGVVAKIVPFNHPILFAVSRVAAPLVAGNAVVLKPSESTPLSALEFGRIAREVLPAGVLSVVVGDGPELPDAIVRHPEVYRIGFTGSEPVGRAIQRAAAEVAVKHVSLELGGKNALIAFPDADPDEVARGAVRGMNFTWSGQSCGSTSRLLVHESIADEVLAKAAAMLEGRQYPSPLDPEAVQGTLVNRRQYDRVLGFISTALTEGATVVTGGGPPAVDKGLFVAPTILDRVTPDSTIANQEVFGPVLSVLRWGDDDDPVALANSVRYGLTGSVYTNDVRRAHRVARALQTGFVWINGSAAHFTGMPFGGWKNSGVGTEEDLDELLSYTRSKSINVML